VTIVKISQGNANSYFHVRTTTLAVLVAMSATTKEAGKEVKWIMMLTTSSSLLALLQSFITVLVIYLAGVWIGQSFVSFGNFDKLLFGFFTSSVVVLVISRGVLYMKQEEKEERTGSYLDGTFY